MVKLSSYPFLYAEKTNKGQIKSQYKGATVMKPKVCLCKHVLEDTVSKAISEGANTVEQVKRQTGASAGACKGSRCLGKIHEMLQESKDSSK